MIENKETAYCMAKLEDRIREDYKRADNYLADNYLDFKDGERDDIYNRMILRWSAMITAFEIAFGVSYFNQY